MARDFVNKCRVSDILKVRLNEMITIGTNERTDARGKEKLGKIIQYAIDLHSNDCATKRLEFLRECVRFVNFRQLRWSSVSH